MVQEKRNPEYGRSIRKVNRLNRRMDLDRRRRLHQRPRRFHHRCRRDPSLIRSSSDPSTALEMGACHNTVTLGACAACLGACHIALGAGDLGAYPGVGAIHSTRQNSYLGAYPGDYGIVHAHVHHCVSDLLFNRGMR